MKLYKKLLCVVTLVAQTATFTWNHEHRDHMHEHMREFDARRQREYSKHHDMRMRNHYYRD